jgi:hypothetical protein
METRGFDLFFLLSLFAVLFLCLCFLRLFWCLEQNDGLQRSHTKTEGPAASRPCLEGEGSGGPVEVVSPWDVFFSVFDLFSVFYFLGFWVFFVSLIFLSCCLLD